jgi:hypothetical protein
MRLLVIFGPPAVGKMTVGDEITKLTGMPLFHNHLSIEPIIRFFPFGTPPFHRLVDSFRRNLIQEVSENNTGTHTSYKTRAYRDDWIVVV